MAKKYLKLENGIPDACTFRNIIRAIDTQQLHEVFVEWMSNVVKQCIGVVAIDGKQARRTKDAKKKPLHVVSAFSAECPLVLGQLACEEKSNEITAIPKLLEMLEIKGCIVTIDAMGTQTEIAQKINERGADYMSLIFQPCKCQKMSQPQCHYIKYFVTIKAKMNVEDSLDSDKIFVFWQLSGCAVSMCHKSKHSSVIITDYILARKRLIPKLCK